MLVPRGPSLIYPVAAQGVFCTHSWVKQVSQSFSRTELTSTEAKAFAQVPQLGVDKAGTRCQDCCWQIQHAFHGQDSWRGGEREKERQRNAPAPPDKQNG